MEGKSINRYHSFCRCLNNLKDAKGKDSNDKFILSGTVQMFNLSFDLAWKVMKDLIKEFTSRYYQVMDRFMKKAAEYYNEQNSDTI